jgi:hypothetical protein
MQAQQQATEAWSLTRKAQRARHSTGRRDVSSMELARVVLSESRREVDVDRGGGVWGVQRWRGLVVLRQPRHGASAHSRIPRPTELG